MKIESSGFDIGAIPIGVYYQCVKLTRLLMKDGQNIIGDRLISEFCSKLNIEVNDLLSD
jgi:hypothetical protein